MMKKSSYRIALGGIIAALCTVIMFFTGVIPLGVYALPAAAGVLLVVLVMEANMRWALLTYAVVAILSLFITPDMEAKLMFLFFLGYYPIIKAKLEQIRSRALEWAVKLAIFNASVVLAYLAIIHVVGMADVIQELGSFGRWSPLVLLGLGNITFVLYDVAITRLISMYIHHRPKILGRFK